MGMNLANIMKQVSNIQKKAGAAQQELANKLCVTDRAVSHWENGRSLPEVGYFKEA